MSRGRLLYLYPIFSGSVVYAAAVRWGSAAGFIALACLCGLCLVALCSFAACEWRRNREKP